MTRGMQLLGHLLLAGVGAMLVLLFAALALDGDARFDVPLSLAVIGTVGVHVFALSGGRRSLRVARAFIRRGWIAFLSYRFQVLFVFVQLAVFVALLVTLGRPLVEALFAPVGVALSGYTATNYVVFLLLGMAFFPILWTSYEVSSARIRQEQMTGLFETLVPTAAGVEALPFAYLVSTFGTSILTILAVLLVFSNVLPAGALAVTDPHALIAFLAVLTLSAATMWGLGLVMGGLTTVFKQAQSASSLLRILLLVFGGVYIPPAILPEWGRAISAFLPITYAGEGVRAVLAEGARVTDILPQLGALAAFALVTTVGGMWLYHRLLNRARRVGTLYGY